MTSIASPQEYAQYQQLLEKSKGQLNLTAWSYAVNNGMWVPRDFDLKIIELIEKYAIKGKVSRILLSVPSRHGKSTLISRKKLIVEFH